MHPVDNDAHKVILATTWVSENAFKFVFSCDIFFKCKLCSKLSYRIDPIYFVLLTVVTLTFDISMVVCLPVILFLSSFSSVI